GGFPASVEPGGSRYGILRRLYRLFGFFFLCGRRARLLFRSALPLRSTLLFSGLLLRLGGLLFLFHERLALFFVIRAHRQIFFAVEIQVTVNKDLLGHGVDAERVMVVNHQVGVLAGFDGADALVDAQLDGRIDGDQAQGLVFGEPAILHHLRGFLVQVPGFLGVVGIDGYDDAAARHDRRVVGNGLVGLDLVGPPVGKRGGARAVLGDFVGHAVSLEYVLERVDTEAELLRQPHELQHFVSAVTVGVDPALPFQHFHERVELQVAPRGDRGLVARGHAAVVLVPGLLVFARVHKGLADHVHHAHAAFRITLRDARRRIEIIPLGVFAQREFDAERRAFKLELVRRLAPAQFDELVLPANGIGAAVEHVGHGHAAGEVAVDLNVVPIQDVADSHHRADRHAAFVDAALDGDVRVAVNDSGGNEHAGG